MGGNYWVGTERSTEEQCCLDDMRWTNGDDTADCEDRKDEKVAVSRGEYPERPAKVEVDKAYAAPFSLFFKQQASNKKPGEDEKDGDSELATVGDREPNALPAGLNAKMKDYDAGNRDGPQAVEARQAWGLAR